MKNVIIIGSGPAGISASLYTSRAGYETTVISNGASALQRAEKIENYYGFCGTGPELYEAGRKNAAALGVSFIDDEVVSVEFGEKFGVATTGGKLFADVIIVAAGTSRKTAPIPGLSELEGRGVSSCAVCDGFFYRGKNVAVLGSGAYAKNEADELLPLAATVTVFTNGEEPTAEFDEKIKIVKEKVVSVNGSGRVESITLENGENPEIDGVFIALGIAGAEALAKKIGIITEKGEIKVDADMSTNVPGIFAAGDCTGGLLQVSKAVSDGAIAGMSAIKYLRK